MIPQWQLTGFKAFVDRSMTDECVIERGVSVTKDSGHHVTGWNVVATVKMRLLPENRRLTGDNTIGGKEMNRSYFRAMLPPEADIRDGDRLRIDGKRYEVLRLGDRATDKAFIQADVARMADE